MLFSEFRNYFTQQLEGVYEVEDIHCFFWMLLGAYHQKTKKKWVLEPHLTIGTAAQKKWQQAIDRLLQEQPIQYILGTAFFYESEFEVNENTLIPRPETEELVAWIIADYQDRVGQSLPIKILDIGTGSGCIAISVAKKLPLAQVTALDIDEKALETAQRNAAKLQVATIKFEQKNILETTTLAEQYDIIVSNPPYVRMLEKTEIKKNVLDYEPHKALFVADDNALVFYEKITQLAAQNLTQNGLLYFEINQYLATEMEAMMAQYPFTEIVLKQDFRGNDRMMRCTKR